MTTTASTSTTTSLALGMQGHTIGRYYAAIGAARVLSEAWPRMTMRWTSGLQPVLTGGPATLHEAADAIRALSIDLADGGLPRVHLDDIPTRIDRDTLGGPQTAPWQGPDGEIWQHALTGAGTLRLHPMIWPHAAQTIRGMIRKCADVVREDPDLLDRTLRHSAGGYTTAYPGGLWLERNTIDSTSAAPPAVDWLTIMALPWLPSVDRLDPATLQMRWVGSAVGWHVCETEWHNPKWTRHVHRPYATWSLWRRDIPVLALADLLAAYSPLLDGPTFAARRARRSGPQDPPMMQPLTLP